MLCHNTLDLIKLQSHIPPYHYTIQSLENDTHNFVKIPRKFRQDVTQSKKVFHFCDAIPLYTLDQSREKMGHIAKTEGLSFALFTVSQIYCIDVVL